MNEIRTVFCADERARSGMNDQDRFQDKANFVHNLGVLLSQTRENIVGCVLVDNDEVQIVYAGEDKNKMRCVPVNIEADSYIAIVKDVLKKIEY